MSYCIPASVLHPASWAEPGGPRLKVDLETAPAPASRRLHDPIADCCRSRAARACVALVGDQPLPNWQRPVDPRPKLLTKLGQERLHAQRDARRSRRCRHSRQPSATRVCSDPPRNLQRRVHTRVWGSVNLRSRSSGALVELALDPELSTGADTAFAARRPRRLRPRPMASADAELLLPKPSGEATIDGSLRSLPFDRPDGRPAFPRWACRYDRAQRLRRTQ